MRFETLRPDEKYLNWAGIPVSVGLHKNVEVLVLENGEGVAWIVWNEIEVCDEICINLDSLFCLFEYRGNNYGRELFERLCALHPEKKILGMIENPVLKNWVDQHNHSIAKATSLASRLVKNHR